ncbi:23873_t:CDS:2 [Cetraspora pellucida]|uniref:23873_t:CDS:1 n=1 Tax=Cetraspora pellucida TaxID=1433469 RepID=A0A9N9E1D8_9GLOM|nr:23873_t:CDS:2 [Cetraspora pellucida]
MHILNLKDNYPKIDITRCIGNRNYNYQYKVLNLVQVLIYKQNVICQTNYQPNGQVKFKVTWKEKTGQKHKIISTRSSSDAAKQFVQKLTQNKNVNLSGIILFGLDLQCLESRQKNEFQRKNFLYLKSDTQKNFHLKEFAFDLYSYSKILLEKYNISNTNLDCFELNISNKLIKIKFTESKDRSASIDSIIYACDKGLISRDSYRHLAAVQPLLE